MVRLLFILLFSLLFILTPSLAQSVLVSAFNQTQTVNITGIASTTNQAIIDSYLNINGDGLTWDVIEEEIVNETELSFITPVEAFRHGTDTPTPTSCAAGSLDSSDNVYCSEVTADSTEVAYVNSTHFISVPDDATIKNVSLCVEFYLSSRSHDNANDYTALIIGENSTGVWSYTTIDSRTGTAGSDWYTEAIRCYDVTGIIDTPAKARYVMISIYHYEADDPNQGPTVDWVYLNVTYAVTTYGLSVEHNATVAYFGTLRNVSVLINFTSTNGKTFNMSIYDFVNSNWVSCHSISASPNIYYTIWCNITSNSTNFISPDEKIRVRLSTTEDSTQTTLKEEYVQFYLFYSVGYLEVKLISPSTSTTNYIVQNQTFWVNATVTCKNGDCGIVNGTVLYNLTSDYPDTPINTTYGDKPFFINESQPSATKTCGELFEEQSCNLSWLVNATGDVSTYWKIGVVFNSNFSYISQNATENTTIYISPCPIDFELTWSYIDFGVLNPSTQANPAPGNSELLYNISIKPGSCNLDFYIRGEDLYNPETGSYLGISNISVSNSTNSYDSSFRILNTYQLLFFNLTQGNYTTYYWIDVPAIYAGTYTSIIYILGVISGTFP